MIYLDNNATTRLAPEVLEIMTRYYMQDYANPNSIHSMGLTANMAMEEAREKIASLLGANPREIFFTSCATESINWALRTATSFRGNRKKVITSSIEHKAVLNTFKDLKNTHDIEIVQVPPEKDGVVLAEKILKEIDDDTYLVSLMAVNNVTGAIQPFEQLGNLLAKKGIFYHIDAVQTIGKMPFSLKNSTCDFASFSAHKFHGPKGIGILYVRKNTKLRPFITGGGQERGMRSGTQNVPGIVGTALALELAVNSLEETSTRLNEYRKIIIETVKEIGGVVNTPFDHSIPNTLNVSIPGIRGEILVNALSEEGICVGTSSACSSRSDGGQYVLEAMKANPEQTASAIRISMSRETTEQDILTFIGVLKKLVATLKF